jgi:hypothetical protein
LAVAVAVLFHSLRVLMVAMVDLVVAEHLTEEHQVKVQEVLQLQVKVILAA